MNEASPRPGDRHRGVVGLLRAILVSALLTTASYVYHQRQPVSGWFQWSDITILDVVQMHATYESFATRVLTTHLALAIAWRTPLSLSQTFAILWFGGIFLSGIAAFVLGRLVARHEGGGWTAMVMLLASWPVFNLFVSPLAGWDDPLQFCFILVSLICLVLWVRRGRLMALLGFGTFTLLGLFARETGMLLLPSILLIACSKLPRRRWWLTGVVGVLPLPLWWGCRWLLTRNHFQLLSHINHNAVRKDWVPHTRHMLINFGTVASSLQSIAAPIVVLAPYCCLLVLAWPRLSRAVRVALVGALALNTMAVLLFALADEARLLFLPVLLLAPCVGWVARDRVLRGFRPDAVRAVARGWGIVVLAALIAASFAISSYVYPSLESAHRLMETWAPLVVAAILGVFTYSGARLDRRLAGAVREPEPAASGVGGNLQ